MSSRSIRKIDALTSLRGYLALWVVLYHFWNDFVVFFPQLEFLSTIIAHGNMAVPGFFILSGFVLAYNYGQKLKNPSFKDIRYFLMMRLARIYPVHLVTLLIVFAMVIVSKQAGFQLTNSGYSILDFVLNIFLVHTWVPHFNLNWNYPSWSISSEWFAYIIFPILVIPFSKMNSKMTLAVTALCSSLITVLWMTFQRDVIFYELFLVVPLFIMGMCVSYFSEVKPSKIIARSTLKILTFGLPLVLFACCYLEGPLKIFSIVLTLLALVHTLSEGGDQSGVVWNRTVPLYLGDVSYSLYMTHTLAQKMLYKIAPSQRYIGADLLTRSMGFALYLAAVCIFCAMVYYTVEKPSLNYFKKKIQR